jgi:hypothetical protein
MYSFSPSQFILGTGHLGYLHVDGHEIYNPPKISLFGMPEFQGKEEPSLSEPVQTQRHLKTAIELELWYREHLKKAEAEYRILKQVAENSAGSLIWPHLLDKWYREHLRIKNNMCLEISNLEAELLYGISNFEIELHTKTEEWKCNPENWIKLTRWRQELQALQRCEELRSRIL